MSLADNEGLWLVSELGARAITSPSSSSSRAANRRTTLVPTQAKMVLGGRPPPVVALAVPVLA